MGLERAGYVIYILFLGRTRHYNSVERRLESMWCWRWVLDGYIVIVLAERVSLGYGL